MSFLVVNPGNLVCVFHGGHIAIWASLLSSAVSEGRYGKSCLEKGTLE